MKELFLFNDYYQLCEELFLGWKEEDKKLKDDRLLGDIVDLTFPPKPYVILKQGDTPLFILNSTTSLKNENSPKLNLKSKKYIDFARELGGQYVSLDYHSGFFTKTYNKIDLATDLGFNSVIDIATIPFFSKVINQSKVINEIRTSYILFAYMNSLQIFLFDKSVLIPVHAESEEEINLEYIKKNDWLLFQLNLLDVSVDELKMSIIDKQNNRIRKTLFRANNKYLLITSNKI